MTAVTRAKLVLGAVAVLLFTIGTRNEIPALRWIAVGVLLLAVLLRFYRPRA